MLEASKTCKNCSKNFTIEPDDFDFYEKIKVPPPTFCFECRTIRRLMWRNERVWYKRVCDATGKSILSMYAPELPLTVYEHNYWKSDAWDPLSYAQEYDFSKSFFDQFQKLFQTVPHPNLIQKNNVNSEYTNHTLNLKNCYFCVSTDTGEDSSYTFTAVVRVKNCFDIHMSQDLEYCAEAIDSKKSNRSLFIQNCEGCVESAFMYDCRNCSNCFGCVGLRNRQYYIFNKQYSKEDYRTELAKYWNGNSDSLEDGKKKFEALKMCVPRKYASILNAQNVSGDDIIDARNCQQCFVARNNVENCKYSFRLWENTKDGWDGFVAWKGSELFYEVVSITGQRMFFSAYIWGGSDIEYSYNCFDCNNIFGCVGLRNKSYCVFNKQYSKEEYEAIVLRIRADMRARGEYGEFFPASISPFAYNETICQDYFPISKDEVLAKGFRYREPEEKHYNITIQSADIPKDIKDVSDTITKEVLGCAHGGNCAHQCATAFRITTEELQFYRMMKLPLPVLCPSCRHFGRVQLKNPLKLWHAKCQCVGNVSKNGLYENTTSHSHAGESCGNEFETSYSPDRPEIIYCEKCYQKEIL